MLKIYFFFPLCWTMLMDLKVYLCSNVEFSVNVFQRSKGFGWRNSQLAEVWDVVGVLIIFISFSYPEQTKKSILVLQTDSGSLVRVAV